jgi:hypothetical protein
LIVLDFVGSAGNRWGGRSGTAKHDRAEMKSSRGKMHRYLEEDGKDTARKRRSKIEKVVGIDGTVYLLPQLNQMPPMHR